MPVAAGSKDYSSKCNEEGAYLACEPVKGAHKRAERDTDMGRMRRAMRLRELGIELPRTTTPEEEAEIRARMAEHIVRQRRMTLTNGLVAWLWDDEDKLRERARAAVAAWREAKRNSVSASRPAQSVNEPRSQRDPYKLSFESLSRSRHPEDLAEFKRRIALFDQMVREEAARGKET
jgi:hypothetical protein